MDQRKDETETVPLNLKKFFDPPKFTDFKIKTAVKEFKVHKVVICAQSQFFSHMFNADWKETDKNEIELKEDDPLAIEAMIHFMYGFRNKLGGGSGDASTMLLSARVYGVAEKYFVVGLKQWAKTRFRDAVKMSWDTVDFPNVVREIYASTHSTVRELRDELGYATEINLRALQKKKEFQDVLEECAGFSVDMVRILGERPPKKNVW